MSLGEQLGRLLIHEQVSEDEAKMRILAQHDDVVSELNMMNGYSDLAGVNRKRRKK